MALTLTALSEPSRLPFDEIIDVRSPAEFAEDHVPGAVNLPVLDDAERARVGTIYVQESRFLARRVGAALVARNAARHLEGYLADKGPGYRPLVYCWRGGQRSGSLALILAQVGWRVETVAGGYRSYRALVYKALYETPVRSPVVVLDGNTGTAKTEVLAEMAKRGAQVIDLEGLANHRGSLFGARAGGQPGQKLFESRLCGILEGLDPARPVIVEAESSKIGDRIVPPKLWAAMRQAPRVVIEASRAERAAYLARAYADVIADTATFEGVLAALRPYHARDVVDEWVRLFEAGAHEALATELMEQHYDPRYARSRASRTPVAERVVPAGSLAPDAIGALAAAVLEEADVVATRGVSLP